MYIVREVVQCKPGKVRDMVNKFKGLSNIAQTLGYGPFRIYTDVSGEQFWTVVSDVEVENIDDFFAMTEKAFAQDGTRELMSGYHDLVKTGRREIYKVA
jgi:hypothetical protein